MSLPSDSDIEGHAHSATQRVSLNGNLVHAATYWDNGWCIAGYGCTSHGQIAHSVRRED